MTISSADQTPQLTPEEIADQASKPDHEQIYVNRCGKWN